MSKGASKSTEPPLELPCHLEQSALRRARRPETLLRGSDASAPAPQQWDPAQSPSSLTEGRSGGLTRFRRLISMRLFQYLRTSSHAKQASSQPLVPTCGTEQRTAKVRRRSFLRSKFSRSSDTSAAEEGGSAAKLLPKASQAGARRPVWSCAEPEAVPHGGPTDTNASREESCERAAEQQARAVVKGGRARRANSMRRRGTGFKSRSAKPEPSSPSLFSFLGCWGFAQPARQAQPARWLGGPLSCLGVIGPSCDAETWTPISEVLPDRGLAVAPDTPRRDSPRDCGGQAPAKHGSLSQKAARTRLGNHILDTAQLEWGSVHLSRFLAEGSSSSQESTCEGSSGDEESSSESVEPMDWHPLHYLHRLTAAEHLAVEPSLNDLCEYDELPPGLPSGPMYKPPLKNARSHRTAAPENRAWAGAAQAMSVRAAMISVEEQYQLQGLMLRDQGKVPWQCTQKGPTAPPSAAASDAEQSAPDWLQSTFRAWGDSAAGTDSWARPPQPCQGVSSLCLSGVQRLGGPWARSPAVWTLDTSSVETSSHSASDFWGWAAPCGPCGSGYAFSRQASFASGMNVAGAASRSTSVSEELLDVCRIGSQESAVSFNSWLS